MELISRFDLMNWLVGQGLTGLPENEMLRGFCERCRTGGLDLSRVIVFIDTLHPIYEGRGFRWNDVETNEADSFEYGSSSQGETAQNWRRSVFHYMLENGQDGSGTFTLAVRGRSEKLYAGSTALLQVNQPK